MSSRHCDYVAEAMPRTTFAGKAKLCKEQATHKIVYATPLQERPIDPYGFLCEAHLEPFKTFVGATQPDPERYTFVRLKEAPHGPESA